MKITIYQIDTAKDTDNAAFMSLSQLQKIQGDSDVRSERYNEVYKGEITGDTLEDAYFTFNVDRPEDYKARSLSVSDVVRIEGSPVDKDGFYFCDSFGFKEIKDFDPEKAGNENRPIDYKTEVEEGNEANKKSSSPEMMQVLLVQPMREPKVIEIEAKSLESMQKVVDGYIEAVYPFEDDPEIALICNEEGKLNGKELNRAVYDSNHEVMDVIAGDFFICSAPESSDNFEGLSAEAAKKYARKFRDPEIFISYNGMIKALPCRLEPEKNHVSRSDDAR